MRRIATIAILLCAAACRGRTEPEQAVARYAAAIKRGDCETVWSTLSRETQLAYESVVQHPSYLTPKSPKEAACNGARVEDWRLSRMRTIPSGSNRVTVLVKRAERTGPSLPGWSPIFTKYVNDPIAVVFEDGAWRVEEQHVVEMVAARRAAIDRDLRARQEALRERERRLRESVQP